MSLAFSSGVASMAAVSGAADLRRVLDDPWLNTGTIIVKPNWVSRERADFTDSATLRLLFEALDANFVVTESHMILRALRHGEEGPHFCAGDQEGNWRWLLTGDGWKWLIRQPDWSWFREEGHWERLREEDQSFRDEFGFTDLFEEFGVTYINVTDEVWSGKSADSAAVRSAVEARFGPIRDDTLLHLCDLVPQTLYNLRPATFVSLAKLKMYSSFTMKNIFGMIPDPLRPWWHGPDNARIARSIVAVNKIYHALFRVYGICEALGEIGVAHEEGEYQGTYSGRYNVQEGMGFIAHGRDLVTLDAALLRFTAPWIPQVDEVNLAPIELAAEEFVAQSTVAASV